jgi:hypothetical protein
MTIEELIANANATTCRKNPLYLETEEGDTYVCRKGVQNQFIDLDADIVPQFKAIYNRMRVFETLPKRLKKTAWMNQEYIFILFKGQDISIKPLDIITVEMAYDDKKMTCYSPDILKTLKKMLP